MIRIIKRCTVAVVLLGLIPSVHAVDKLNIFVSILPQKYFVERVGGEHVDVSVMVGPGQSPATYEPTPQQMAKLAKADIYFSIGVPFESAWLNQIRKNNKNLMIVECCRAFTTLKHDGHAHSHNHTHLDPHIWTSPKNVIQLSMIIEKSLSRIDPVNKNNFIAASARFIVALKTLDQEIAQKTAHLKNKTMIVSHPSWGYFSENYGFTQVSIEQTGKEIQGNAMTKLIDFAKQNNIRAVFTQPQFNNKAAEVIAAEIDAALFELDPLAENYIVNMQEITNKIVQGLSQ